MKEITPDELAEFLENNGWKPGSQSFSKSMWYKRFPHITPSCSGNSDKPGMQVCVDQYVYDVGGREHISYEISMCGGRPDDVWANIKLYSLSAGQVRMNLHNYIKALSSAWQGINGQR